MAAFRDALRRHVSLRSAVSEPLERRTLLSLSPDGGVFRVNGTETNDQIESDVAMAADGDFVSVWWALDRGANTHGISGRLFNADGTPKGSDFVIAPAAGPFGGSAVKPTVAMAADGRFVVAWLAGVPGGNDAEIRARLFGASGQPVGGSFSVDPAIDMSDVPVGNNRDITAAMSDDGRFVVAWLQGRGGTAVGQRIAARVFDATGQPVGAGFTANNSADSELRLGVGSAMDADGDFVLTWRHIEAGVTTRNDRIVARLFRSNGAPRGQEFTVGASDEAGAPAAGMDADGDFVVTWQQQGGSPGAISARLFGSAGQARGGEFTVYTRDRGNQLETADVAMADDGKFLVAWRVDGTDGDVQDHWAFARHYSAVGQPLNNPVVLHHGGRPSASLATNAGISAAGDRAVVAWGRADSPTPGNDNVYARRLSESAPPPPPDVNRPPDATAIADVTVDQDAPDTRIELFDVFDDDRDSDTLLDLSVSGNTNPGLFTATAINGDGTLILNYAPGASGNAALTVTARDTGGLSTSVSFDVTVRNTAPPPPPNLPPVALPISTIVVGQDAPDTVIDLRAAFDDPEDVDAALRFAVTGNSNPGLFSSVTVKADGTLTLDYAPAANGIAQLVVTATDTGGLSTASAFSVVVNSPGVVVPPAPPPQPTGQPAPPGPGSITGALFDDADASGRRSKGEPPLAGVRVFLDADGDGAFDVGETATTTGADGSFAITNLAAGVYRVRAEVPAGRAGGAADVIVRAKGRRPARLKPMGVAAAGALAGVVFVDTNANGARDAGEVPVRRARVFLDTNGDGVWQKKAERSTRADRLGSWSFKGIAGGSYRIAAVSKRRAVGGAPVVRDLTLAEGQTVMDIQVA